MASIRKLPGSRFWIACYTDASGRQRQRSTKETGRKAALSLANEYEVSYRKLKTEQQARRVISDIYEEIHGSALGSASTKSFFEQWLVRKKVEVAPASYTRYKSVADKFMKHLQLKAEREISFITAQDVAEFRDQMAASHSTSTANLNLKILRTAFQDAMRQHLIEQNPATLVQTIRKTAGTTKRRAFTLGELKLILESATEEWRGIILVGLYTGQRLGDIALLCWNNVDLTRQEIRFAAQKTGRTVILPIAEPLFRWFLELAAQDDPSAPVFPNSYDILQRQDGRVASLSNQFNRLLSDAGLVDKRTHASAGKGRSSKRVMSALSFHCLRHTATSLLKNAGVSEAVAMDIIGHDSKLVSQNYTHIEESTKRKALSKLPDITEKSNG
jgi:integrase